MRLARTAAPFLALVASSHAFLPTSRRILPTLQLRGTNSDFAINSLDRLTVPALKDLLRSRGLPVSGRKAELLERLRGAEIESESAESSLQTEPKMTNTLASGSR